MRTLFLAWPVKPVTDTMCLSPNPLGSFSSAGVSALPPPAGVSKLALFSVLGRRRGLEAVGRAWKKSESESESSARREAGLLGGCEERGRAAGLRRERHEIFLAGEG